MPSRAEARGGARTAVAALLLVVACARPGAAAAEPPSAPLDASAVEAAASAVRADPDLPGVDKRRTWRFKKADDALNQDFNKPLPWMLALARWLAESGRGLAWLLGAVAVVALTRHGATLAPAAHRGGARPRCPPAEPRS